MGLEPLIKPWIGGWYTSAPLGKRLMLLGESMYTSNTGVYPDDELVKLIGAAANGDTRWRFYGRAFHVIIGKKRSGATPEEVRNFWHSVLFHQYVQKPVIGRPKDRPTDEMWAAAPDYLRHVVAVHRPEAIVVFGKKLSGKLWEAGFISQSESDVRFVSKDVSCSIVDINHPGSLGFSAREWHAEKIVPFLKSLKAL